jgi:hypothetical protein
MTRSIALTLTEDEAEIIVDALETDLEGYIEAANDARANGKRNEVETFTEAAGRIRVVKERLRTLIDKSA